MEGALQVDLQESTLRRRWGKKGGSEPSARRRPRSSHCISMLNFIAADPVLTAAPHFTPARDPDSEKTGPQKESHCRICSCYWRLGCSIDIVNGGVSALVPLASRPARRSGKPSQNVWSLQNEMQPISTGEISASCQGRSQMKNDNAAPKQSPGTSKSSV